MTNAGSPWNPEPPREPRAPDPLPWIALGLAAFLLLTYPWVAPFTHGRHWLGIPLMLWYLFAVWFGLIGVSALGRTGR